MHRRCCNRTRPFRFEVHLVCLLEAVAPHEKAAAATATCCSSHAVQWWVAALRDERVDVERLHTATVVAVRPLHHLRRRAIVEQHVVVVARRVEARTHIGARAAEAAIHGHTRRWCGGEPEQPRAVAPLQLQQTARYVREVRGVLRDAQAPRAVAEVVQAKVVHDRVPAARRTSRPRIEAVHAVLGVPCVPWHVCGLDI